VDHANIHKEAERTQGSTHKEACSMDPNMGFGRAVETKCI